MRVSSETDVAAPLQHAWATLLDLPRVARSLPGATIAADSIDGAHRARTAGYAGSARVLDVDEDEHVATFYGQGHATGGPGMASATIVARLSERDGATHVVLDADVRVTGGVARSADVAASLALLAAGLEREATALAPLELGGPALQPVVERAALLAAGLAIGVLLYRAVRRR
jgi:carbon monoxide dehydrogenase subunit G